MNINDSIFHASAGQVAALRFAADLSCTSSDGYSGATNAAGKGQGPLTFGVQRIDRALHGGLPTGALHEIQAASPADYPSAAAFCLLLGDRCLSSVKKRRRGNILWISSMQQDRHAQQGRGRKLLYAPGLVELGINPDGIIHAQGRDSISALRVAGDAVRSRAITAVILDLPGGKARGLDLTATRRFSLFARESGTTMFLLRSGMKRGLHIAQPSAAYSRWSLTSAASQPLAANAPGHPVFDIELLRHRRGAEGLSARLEWECEARKFTEYTPDTGAVSAPAVIRKDYEGAQQEARGEKLRA